MTTREDRSLLSISNVKRFLYPVAGLNGLNFGVSYLSYLSRMDFNSTLFILMLLESAFAFVLAGLEDIRMTPLGVAFRRLLSGKRTLYSPARHKEALRTANVMLIVGAIMFGESLLFSATLLYSAA